MHASKRYLAFDLGAESGRAVVGSVGDDGISLEEIHRFLNVPVRTQGTLHWDVLRLFGEMKNALKIYSQKYGSDLAGIGIDTWGVDFALLSEDGSLLGNPVHYRDHRTDGTMEKLLEIVPKEKIYEITGIQFMVLNTLNQLLAMRLQDSPLLKNAATFLMMADLFAYFLSGRKVVEYTNATTTQLYDLKEENWSKELFKRLELPIEIMPEIVPPGTILGPLSPEVAKEAGLGEVPVIAPASHDTGSAVAAVPAEGEGWMFVSCGTWSVVGAEVTAPIANENALDHNFANEGGVNKTIRFLKNCLGLWVLQQCRQVWNSTGEELDYAQLAQMASQSPPFSFFINIDDPAFLKPANMVEAIKGAVESTGQKWNSDIGCITRSILEGLAFRYREIMEELEEVLGTDVQPIHIIGGGCQNELLCQLTANATGRKVVAGPSEATAIGNIAMQAIAAGELASLAEARALIRRSFPPKVYEPSDTSQWQSARESFQKIAGNKENQ